MWLAVESRTCVWSRLEHIKLMYLQSKQLQIKLNRYCLLCFYQFEIDTDFIKFLNCANYQ